MPTPFTISITKWISTVQYWPFVAVSAVRFTLFFNSGNRHGGSLEEQRKPPQTAPSCPRGANQSALAVAPIGAGNGANRNGAN